MAILLSVTGVTYSAVCVWLTVRIINRRERWAKRTLAAAVSLPILYMLSFAPLLWLDAHGYIDHDSLVHDAGRIYAAPVRAVYETGPQLVRDVLNWYQNVFR
ncbi:MAG TPA: hypothetical protein VGH74_18035 [Planctomycetaceae bacterium]|jgi:hypothetical protein